MEFKISRSMGYASVRIWRFAMIVVWGFCGNVYPREWVHVFRVDLAVSKVCAAILSYESFRCDKTDLYVYYRARPAWNSEHIARRYGEYVCPDCYHPNYAPDHHVYDGWLGRHIAL